MSDLNPELFFLFKVFFLHLLAVLSTTLNLGHATVLCLQICMELAVDQESFVPGAV